ncbi:MAG TPA: DUF4097 family beta strand repeat-containing protein [Longimicrobiales bacterium]|nr:DUF4097 family beta strand repeat-containing protein [Longimicrobiales bacterium]
MRTMWTRTTIALAALSLAGPVQAQERDWDDLSHRIEAAFERAMAEAEWATARALAALEDVDWASLRWEMDWDDDRWADEWAEAWDDEWDGAWHDDWRDDGDGEGVQERQEFRWSGRVDAGDVLEIKGVNGPITAGRASGNEIEVVAVKTGRRSDPESVRIDVIEHGGGVTLCAVYPTPEGREENECGVGSDGRSSTERNDVQVAWEVRVPADVRFRGRTVNGDVEATDLREDVDVATVNGDVEVTTAGFAEARTVNGSIRARMDGAPTEDVSFETVNGSITLDVDDGLDADLDAEWLNGSLETDIPFQLQGRMGRRSARGSLGDGGSLIRLRTVNGSIRIR